MNPNVCNFWRGDFGDYSAYLRQELEFIVFGIYKRSIFRVYKKSINFIFYKVRVYNKKKIIKFGTF